MRSGVFVGDFNVVHEESERRGVGKATRMNESREFNEFIAKTKLVDLPRERRKFTWYKDNGKCGSRLDRFLLSGEWLAKWPNVAKYGLRRSMLDHTTILLKEDEINWVLSRSNT